MPIAKVQMKAIEKSFSSNKVLHGVDFTLEKGTIHALLGENGTGKTTLMNILGGVIAADKGEIYIDGKKVSITNPAVATQNGIAFIHQELTLINDLTVYENLFLGRETKKGIALNKKLMQDEASNILKRMDINLDPQTFVRELGASYKQIIEIARALMKNARVIIMDEPTASLTDVEIESIFKIMNALKKEGVSFVFISHKLNEVVKICDDYTVMRDGKVVATGKIDESVTENSLAKYMVGKDLKYDDIYRTRKCGQTVLEIKNLSREKEFSNINFNLKKGEIVGVTGLLGDGHSDVFATVYGCNKDYKGEIYVNGKLEHMNSTKKALTRGISYVASNRKENGIIKDLSVWSNMSIAVLKKIRKLFFIDSKKENKTNEEYVDKLNVKVSDVKGLITSLSGGNQQKVVIAKALETNPDIVILDNPTQGVDIGAKLEIYSIIMKLAETGISFVILSSEAQEIMMLCDRAYVMFHGEIKVELDREHLTQENIMVVATGGSLSKNESEEG